MLQLEDRLGISHHTATILSENPTRGSCRRSRRLQGSLDRMNPHSWTGSTAVGTVATGVRLTTCWTTGRERAATILRRNGLFTAEELNFDAISQEGVTMFRPRGNPVGFTDA